MIRAVRELTDKVTLREYGLSHALAKEWGTERSPAPIMAPEVCKIRWLGAPLGHEVQTFMAALAIFEDLMTPYWTVQKKR